MFFFLHLQRLQQREELKSLQGKRRGLSNKVHHCMNCWTCSSYFPAVHHVTTYEQAIWQSSVHHFYSVTQFFWVLGWVGMGELLCPSKNSSHPIIQVSIFEWKWSTKISNKRLWNNEQNDNFSYTILGQWTS